MSGSSFYIQPLYGNRRNFSTIEAAERAARRATERIGGKPVSIRQNDGRELAVCLIDACGRVWTDLTSSGAELL